MKNNEKELIEIGFKKQIGYGDNIFIYLSDDKIDFTFDPSVCHLGISVDLVSEDVIPFIKKVLEIKL